MNQGTVRSFGKLTKFVHEQVGIVIGESKKEFLLHKCKAIIRQFELEDLGQLLQELESGRNQELVQAFINIVTVNTTNFFRETQHFTFIQNNRSLIQQSNPMIAERQELRVWSAACSSGEEPYTLGMVLNEAFGQELELRVLATDIDTGILKKASQGIYPVTALKQIPPHFAQRYFYSDAGLCKVKASLREKVSFRHFNLMNEFPFRHKFDMIFCRNVMIYFDRETQSRLIQKLNEALNVGGLLFTGHSEALPDRKTSFRYIEPSIYMKY